MGLFQVDIEGESEIIAAWGQAYGILKRGAKTAVSKAVKEGAQEARDKHTFRNRTRTRTLEKSIEGFVVGWVTDETYRGVIRAGAKYASHVEYPTKPHEIVARRARWLSFKWKGEWVHFKYVRHPGTKGQPFMHLAYFKAERVLQREMEIAIQKAQDRLNR